MERNVELEGNGTIKTNRRKHNNAWIVGIWNAGNIQGKQVEIVNEFEENGLEILVICETMQNIGE